MERSFCSGNGVDHETTARNQIVPESEREVLQQQFGITSAEAFFEHGTRNASGVQKALAISDPSREAATAPSCGRQPVDPLANSDPSREAATAPNCGRQPPDPLANNEPSREAATAVARRVSSLPPDAASRLGGFHGLVSHGSRRGLGAVAASPLGRELLDVPQDAAGCSAWA